MSEPAARRVAIGVVTTLLGLIAISAWDSKVNRGEYDLHVQEEMATREAILDLLCADHPTHRRCR